MWNETLLFWACARAAAKAVGFAPVMWAGRGGFMTGARCILMLPTKGDGELSVASETRRMPRCRSALAVRCRTAGASASLNTGSR